MSDAPVDLTATIKELEPRHAATWAGFTKTSAYVGGAVAVLLLLLLLIFVVF